MQAILNGLDASLGIGLGLCERENSITLYNRHAIIDFANIEVRKKI